MSKPFDYSKWDNIELSDDEDDVHPNIDRESWFRMKHRSRVEREANEEADKKRIREAMEKSNKRIELLEHDLKKLKQLDLGDDDDSDSDDDDDDLDGRVAIQSEIDELKKENQIRQNKLDEYEKNKKWNVDNMCTVKEERTIINPSGAKPNFTETGFAKSTVEAKIPTSKDDDDDDDNSSEKKKEEKESATKSSSASKGEETATKKTGKTKSSTSATTATTTTVAKTSTSSTTKTTELSSASTPKAAGPDVKTSRDKITMYSYHEFTVKYAELVETFMKIKDLDASKEFLLKYGDILLQENASNYLLLASLEDEMNGYREKMKQTAKQSQIISNIADLAKQLNTHPGNVIMPFFNRLQSQKQYLDGFYEGVNHFIDKIIKRAVTKKIEIDRQRRQESGAGDGSEEPVDLEDVPKEERLGPGGLDPLEVIPTLPETMQKAFESRDVDQLKQALLDLDPKDAEYHMKRCIDSGLWVAQA